MKYYAIGVPVGAFNEHDERYFFRDGQLLNMNGNAFQVWMAFLHGADPDQIVQDTKLAEQIPQDRLNAFLKELVNARLLVPNQELFSCIPQRQGYGTGFSVERQDCEVFLNDAVHVSYPAYVLWSYCDGQSRCEAICARLAKELVIQMREQQLFQLIDELLAKNLLLFVA